MSLIIDSREKKIKEIKDIVAKLDVAVPEIEFKGLPLGDYLIQKGDECMLIERKSMADICGNYVELAPRMDKMRLAYENTALLTEGSYIVSEGYIMLWRGNRLTPSMNYRTYSSFIAGQQKRGSYYYHTMNLEESILRIIYIHDHLDEMGKHPARKAKTPDEIIGAIPGEGIGKAKKLRDKYANPIEAFKNCDSWLSGRARKTLESW